MIFIAKWAQENWQRCARMRTTAYWLGVMWHVSSDTDTDTPIIL